MKHISILLATGKTVFTNQELVLLLPYSNKNSLRQFLSRSKKQNILLNPCPGIWTLPLYDAYELASKILSNSYISLETVLAKNGVIFQLHQDIITLVSSRTRKRVIQGITYSFHKIKEHILSDPRGIETKRNYQIASPERAYCDYVYINKSAYVDNIQALDIEKIRKISLIYPQTTYLRINKYLDGIGNTNS